MAKRKIVEDLFALRFLEVGIDGLHDRIEQSGQRIALLQREIECGRAGEPEQAQEQLLILQLEQTRLELELAIATATVKRLNRGLELLDEDERMVIDWFYIDRRPDYVGDLCESLGYETAHIYRLKDAALRKLSIAVYGAPNV